MIRRILYLLWELWSLSCAVFMALLAIASFEVLRIHYTDSMLIVAIACATSAWSLFGNALEERK